MAANDIFEIEVLNWEKHKGGLKPNHPYFPIKKGIFDDADLANLTTSERLLVVILIGRCAEEFSKQIRCSREWVKKQLGSSKEAVEKQLNSLQSNRIVKWEIRPYKRIEKKRIEKKRKEIKGAQTENREPAAPADAASPVPFGRDLVAHYCETYRSRYGTNPIIKPQDGKALKTLGENLGGEKAKQLITSYLSMNNAWFVTKAHDITTMLQNLNQIQNFVATGQVVTLADARNAEASDSLANQLKRLTGGA